MRVRFILPVSALVILFSTSELQAATTVNVSVPTQVATPIASAPCIMSPEAITGGQLVVKKEGALDVASITVPPSQQAPFSLTLKTGEQSAAPCAEGTELQVQVVPQTQLQISSATVQQAFVVLMATFVLALLMESAFALLFNWRLFQALLVGRAWRTPIMFFASWGVIHVFNLDLMAEVFAAYRGTAVTGSMLTQILTAMIVSGGSVGVNKILIGLGFRSAVPREDTAADQAQLSNKEAWVSVDISAVLPGRLLSIEMHEVEPPQGIVPTLAVFTPGGAGRLRSIMFPSRARLPQSGGMRVIAKDKVYYFAIRDLKSKQLYDINGNGIPDILSSTPFCFAPRAMVDFAIVKLRP